MGGRGSSGGGTKGTEQRVFDAFRHVAENGTGLYSGESAPISDVFDAMEQAGVSRADAARALQSLESQGKVNLYSSNASRMLTERQRAGGIRRGGQDVNIVRLA